MGDAVSREYPVVGFRGCPDVLGPLSGNRLKTAVDLFADRAAVSVDDEIAYLVVGITRGRKDDAFRRDHDEVAEGKLAARVPQKHLR